MVSLVLKNVDFFYRPEQRLIVNLSANLVIPGNEGHIVALIGPSGCGKSTLLRMLARAEHPKSGKIEILPSDVVISFLTQDAVLFEHLTRDNNVCLFSRISSLQPHFEPESVRRLLTELSIWDKVYDPDGVPLEDSVLKLSGGEKQRLCLARCLSIRPKLLLLDEPCTGLDPDVKRSFLTELRELVDRLQILVIYVTHHADEVRLIADSVWFMRTRTEGPTELIEKGVGRFLQSPPSPEAAQVLIPEAMNRLECDVSEGRVFLRGTLAEVGVLENESVAPGEYVLLVPPIAVRSASNGGLRVRTVGRSDLYVFLRPFEQLSATITCPAAAYHQGAQVSISGEGIFFPIASAEGQRVNFV